MPLVQPAPSLVAGGPRVERAPGRLRLRQRRTVGWALLIFALVPPALILREEFDPWPADPLAALTALLRDADTLARIGIGMGALFWFACFGYAVFWLLWHRELDVDLNTRRYRFTTGLGPWRRRHEGRCDEPLRLALSRKVYPGSDAMDSPGSMSGPGRESWELRLTLPGSREPLFLGEWTQRGDAEAEAGAWRAVFPRLTFDAGTAD